jgi:Flp pilus assembly protein TadB
MSNSMGRKRTGRDDWIEDWPWFGGRPGGKAGKLFALYVLILVAFVLAIFYAIYTLQVCAAVVLILVCAGIAALPHLFLIGSRI